MLLSGLVFPMRGILAKGSLIRGILDKGYIMRGILRKGYLMKVFRHFSKMTPKAVQK